MAIFVDKNSRVLVQGATGHQGVFHINAMKEFGTNVVAGVTPGKGGQDVHGLGPGDARHEFHGHGRHSGVPQGLHDFQVQGGLERAQ